MDMSATAVVQRAPHNLILLGCAARDNGYRVSVEYQENGDVWTLDLLGRAGHERFVWGAGKWSRTNGRGYREVVAHYRAHRADASEPEAAEAPAAECSDGSCRDCVIEDQDKREAEALGNKCTAAVDRVSKRVKRVKAAAERGHKAAERAEGARKRARVAAEAEAERLNARVAHADALVSSLPYGSQERVAAGIKHTFARWAVDEGPAAEGYAEADGYADRAGECASEGWDEEHESRAGFQDAAERAEHAAKECAIKYGTFELTNGCGGVKIPSRFDAETAWDIIRAHSRDVAGWVRHAEAAAEAAEAAADQAEAWADSAEEWQADAYAGCEELFSLGAPDARQLALSRSYYQVTDRVAEEWQAEAEAEACTIPGVIVAETPAEVAERAERRAAADAAIVAERPARAAEAAAAAERRTLNEAAEGHRSRAVEAWEITRDLIRYGTCPEAEAAEARRILRRLDRRSEAAETCATGARICHITWADETDTRRVADMVTRCRVLADACEADARTVALIFARAEAAAEAAERAEHAAEHGAGWCLCDACTHVVDWPEAAADGAPEAPAADRATLPGYVGRLGEARPAFVGPEGPAGDVPAAEGPGAPDAPQGAAADAPAEAPAPVPAAEAPAADTDDVPGALFALPDMFVKIRAAARRQGWQFAAHTAGDELWASLVAHTVAGYWSFTLRWKRRGYRVGYGYGFDSSRSYATWGDGRTGPRGGYIRPTLRAVLDAVNGHPAEAPAAPVAPAGDVPAAEAPAADAPQGAAAETPAPAPEAEAPAGDVQADDVDYQAIARGMALVEKAIAKIKRDQYTDRDGDGWHVEYPVQGAQGSPYVLDAVSLVRVRLSYTDDGTRYELRAYDRAGRELACTSRKGLKSALAHGKAMACAEYAPAAEAPAPVAPEAAEAPAPVPAADADQGAPVPAAEAPAAPAAEAPTVAMIAERAAELRRPWWAIGPQNRKTWADPEAAGRPGPYGGRLATAAESAARAWAKADALRPAAEEAAHVVRERVAWVTDMRDLCAEAKEWKVRGATPEQAREGLWRAERAEEAARKASLAAVAAVREHESEAERIESEVERSAREVARARGAVDRMVSTPGRGVWQSADGRSAVSFPMAWDTWENPNVDADGLYVGMLADAVAARDEGRSLTSTDVPSREKTGHGPGGDFKRAVSRSCKQLVTPWKAPRIPAAGKQLSDDVLSGFAEAGDVIAETEAAPGVWLPMAAVRVAEAACENGWSVAMERRAGGAVVVRASGTVERKSSNGDRARVAGECVAVWDHGEFVQSRSGAVVGGRYIGGATLRQVLGQVGAVATEPGTLAPVVPSVESAPAPAGVSDPGGVDAWEGDGGALARDAEANEHGELPPPVNCDAPYGWVPDLPAVERAPLAPGRNLPPSMVRILDRAAAGRVWLLADGTVWLASTGAEARDGWRRLVGETSAEPPAADRVARLRAAGDLVAVPVRGGVAVAALRPGPGPVPQPAPEADAPGELRAYMFNAGVSGLVVHVTGPRAEHTGVLEHVATSDSVDFFRVAALTPAACDAGLTAAGWERCGEWDGDRSAAVQRAAVVAAPAPAPEPKPEAEAEAEAARGAGLLTSWADAERAYGERYSAGRDAFGPLPGAWNDALASVARGQVHVTGQGWQKEARGGALPAPSRKALASVFALGLVHVTEPDGQGRADVVLTPRGIERYERLGVALSDHARRAAEIAAGTVAEGASPEPAPEPEPDAAGAAEARQGKRVGRARLQRIGPGIWYVTYQGETYVISDECGGLWLIAPDDSRLGTVAPDADGEPDPAGVWALLTGTGAPEAAGGTGPAAEADSPEAGGGTGPAAPGSGCSEAFAPSAGADVAPALAGESGEVVAVLRADVVPARTPLGAVALGPAAPAAVALGGRSLAHAQEAQAHLRAVGEDGQEGAPVVAASATGAPRINAPVVLQGGDPLQVADVDARRVLAQVVYDHVGVGRDGAVNDSPRNVVRGGVPALSAGAESEGSPAAFEGAAGPLDAAASGAGVAEAFESKTLGGGEAYLLTHSHMISHTPSGSASGVRLAIEGAPVRLALEPARPVSWVGDAGDFIALPAAPVRPVRPALPPAPARPALPVSPGVTGRAWWEPCERVTLAGRPGRTAHSHIGCGVYVRWDDGGASFADPRALWAEGTEPAPARVIVPPYTPPVRTFAMLPVPAPEVPAVTTTPEPAPAPAALAPVAPVAEPAPAPVAPGRDLAAETDDVAADVERMIAEVAALFAAHTPEPEPEPAPVAPVPVAPAAPITEPTPAPAPVAPAAPRRDLVAEADEVSESLDRAAAEVARLAAELAAARPAPAPVVPPMPTHAPTPAPAPEPAAEPDDRPTVRARVRTAAGWYGPAGLALVLLVLLGAPVAGGIVGAVLAVLPRLPVWAHHLRERRTGGGPRRDDHGLAA